MAKDPIESLKMKIFFTYCKKKLSPICEITGRRVEGSPLNFHHLFTKSGHPEVAFALSNIMVVDGDSHACLNFNEEYFPECVLKRNWIRENWEEVEKESKVLEDKIEKLINGASN